MTKRDSITAALIQRDGNKCSICGEPFEDSLLGREIGLDHILPKSYGGEEGLNNLRLVCWRCNSRVGMETRPIREFEFTTYLLQLMTLSREFRNINAETLLNYTRNVRPDIWAEELASDTWSKILIECKSFSSFTKGRAEEIVVELQFYREKFAESKIALAFPGNLTQEALSLFESSGVEVWDVNYLSKRFEKEVKEVKHPILQRMLLAALPTAEKTREEDLIEKLHSCNPGRENWLVYQKLVGEIFEHLFCPPLSIPISELADASKVNRRDFILPNYTENGFWAYLRSRYLADYIVVDAKNYREKVKKKEVLQIVNYLKPHGAGLFAIIVSRNGGDNGCIHTIKEVWTLTQKLIVLLTDNDMEQMLLAAKTGSPPENVIKQKIEDFRLSL